jgi:hypothetical protein
MISWFWEHTVPLPAKSVRHLVSNINDLELPDGEIIDPVARLFSCAAKAEIQDPPHLVTPLAVYP